MSRLIRLLILAVSAAMIACMGALGAASTATAAPPGVGAKNTVKVTGTGPNGEKFNGQFTASSAQASSAPKGADVVGQLTGTLMTPGQGQGNNPRQVDQQVALPVTDVQQATCQVLNLTLGPLDLTLLGLNVHLDQVHLVITATPGGGILGDLLCSLAGGPGVPGTLGQVIDLLNRILAALGGL
ncbi:hypothetical protein [Mycobacterium sp. 1274761.0]|uniref:hypothetical protein n=1 Tax=Mycobacterium sp. 1274761.0 TaxID=1834077 RepID=UPI0007FFDB63|nr:hypothetical protein [Mycobacterium sp. 1274761.0]OBK78733.1 hypothetical protein A5651_02065 [Mycobacterium sp. 1274761.0]